MYNNRALAIRSAIAAAGMGLAVPAEAAPFAYVTGGDTVTVIDTATNKVEATFPAAAGEGIAVSPDGKRAYTTGWVHRIVSVIDTAANSVVATIKAGTNPAGIAIAPNGKHVYVTSMYLPGACDNPPCSQAVWVIDTATNVASEFVSQAGFSLAIAVTPYGSSLYVPLYFESAVLVFGPGSGAVVPVGVAPVDVAITPNGKRAYVVNQGGPSVMAINTAAKSVVATIGMHGEGGPNGVAITPDGKRAYVPRTDKTFSVIDTATNGVVTGVPVADHLSGGVAITPDGKHVYLSGSSKIYVIDTSTNAVAATIPCRGNQIGIVPPPPGVPFLAFRASAAIHFGSGANQDAFNFHSRFTLSSTDSNGIDPLVERVKIQVGTFSIIIPPRSFKQRLDGSFIFAGVIKGVTLLARIRPAGTLRYAVAVIGRGASLAGSKNPIQVALIIGGDSGTTSIRASELEVATK